VDPLAAKTVSTVVSAVVAFVGNRQWSFAPDIPGVGVGLSRQVGRYVIANVASLVVALLPIEVCRRVLGLDGVVAMNVAANVIGLGLATCFRYVVYRRWVFPAPPTVSSGDASTNADRRVRTMEALSR
jgi:putative flippase GtrA